MSRPSDIWKADAAATANFEDPSAFPSISRHVGTPFHGSTRGTGVIISCAQPDSYWFMTRPKAKLNFPVVIYASWLFSVFSRVCGNHLRVSHTARRVAIPRFISIVAPVAMSFKCRARSPRREALPVAGWVTVDGKSIETSYTNGGRQGVHTDVQTNV